MIYALDKELGLHVLGVLDVPEVVFHIFPITFFEMFFLEFVHKGVEPFFVMVVLVGGSTVNDVIPILLVGSLKRGSELVLEVISVIPLQCCPGLGELAKEMQQLRLSTFVIQYRELHLGGCSASVVVRLLS